MAVAVNPRPVLEALIVAQVLDARLLVDLAAHQPGVKTKSIRET
jgi:hypothetical protein